jgi:hypothetical protein
MWKNKPWSNLSYCSSICLQELCKTTKNFSQDSRDRDLNPGPPEYVVGVLTARSQLSVDLLLLP